MNLVRFIKDLCCDLRVDEIKLGKKLVVRLVVSKLLVMLVLCFDPWNSWLEFFGVPQLTN